MNKSINNLKVSNAVVLLGRLVKEFDVLIEQIMSEDAHKALRIIVAVLLVHKKYFYQRHLKHEVRFNWF